MKKRRFGGILVCLVFLSVASAALAQGGYLPGATDYFTVKQAWDSVGMEPKGTVLDWRDVGGTNYMPPVENQNTCGTCWTFCALHTLEGRIRIDESPAFSDDFSEDAMADCTLPGGCSYGGNFWKATGYLSAMGPVLETCQGWTPGSTNCLSCPQQDYRVKKMITIGETTAAIKAALANGPVGTSMDTGGVSGGETAFDNYDGSYVMTDGSPSSTNHCVTIVGYHEGSADPGYLAGNYWIVQNSWGTGWGDNGYFYIEYGAALIGSNNFQITEWEASLSSQSKVLLFEDENGADGVITGSIPNTVYACQRLTPTTDGEITEIQWANAGNNFDWEVRVYDNFTGSAPYTQLGITESGTNEPNGGYTYVTLTNPIPVTSGDSVYVCVKMNNPSGPYFSVDVTGPSSGGAYISTSAITSGYSGLSYDWGIRAIVNTNVSPTATPTPGVPSTSPAGIGFLLAVLGAFLLFSLNRR